MVGNGALVLRPFRTRLRQMDQQFVPARTAEMAPRGMMDLPKEQVRELRAWAKRNDSVRELWLFGSRAKGTSKPESDVDIALALMPAHGKHDWAMGKYFDLHVEWKQELEKIVGRHVSLQAIETDSEGDVEVRRTGVLMWARD